MCVSGCAMKWVRASAVSLALLLPVLGHAASGRPRGPADEALAALKAGQARIDALIEREVGKKPPEEWRPKLRKAVNAFIDFAELARRALGSHWQKRSTAEQERFQATMKALIESAYLSRVTERAEYQVEYLGAEGTKNGEVRVKTVLRARDAEIPVEYLLYRKDGRWLVYDIVTDGLSLLENYRTQFNRLIKRKGFEGLIETLERKRAELERLEKEGS
ncbi:MAG: ABC transporter substrate-binding protein [Deltaproteobacteria bacterium]|nr:MAG: ABC transporter substrate-binding protein [Deltaproteobacteria bacterium]